MVKCPFCSFANEDGALFCEQCKSDISSVAPAAPPVSMSPPTPMPESISSAEVIPMAEVEPIAEMPVMAAIIEETPMAEVIPTIVEEAPAAEFPTAALETPPTEPIAEIPVAEMPVPAPEPPPDLIAAPAPLPAMAPVIMPVVSTPPAPPVPVATPGQSTPIPPGASPILLVQRGLKTGEQYSLFPGENFIGRADDKPVDVDLTFQEPEDRVWCSRQHALIVYDDATGSLTIEDLNSSNGTFVNRERVYPGQPRPLFVGNTVQIGTVHMKIKV